MAESQWLKDVPGASRARTVSITGLVCACLCFCPPNIYILSLCVIPLVLSITGIILGTKARKTYEAEPESYIPRSVKQAKSAVTVGIIGVIVTLVGSGIGLMLISYFRGE